MQQFSPYLVPRVNAVRDMIEPNEPLREGDEVLGTLEDPFLRKAYVLHIALFEKYLSSSNEDFKVRIDVRKAYNASLARLFPAQAERVGKKVDETQSRVWAWGMRKGWQIVIYPQRLPSICVL